MLFFFCYVILDLFLSFLCFFLCFVVVLGYEVEDDGEGSIGEVIVFRLGLVVYCVILFWFLV